jgi:prepilin-type N-terminal cleavage/methylation domain-containing protein
MSKYKITQYKKGFTLIEVIMVVSLNTLLLVVITSTITQLYKNQSYTFEQSNEIEVARKGLGTWVRDAREMSFAANGTYPLVKVGTSTMGFFGDIDKDNNVEYVEYSLATTTIRKKTFNPIGFPATYSTTTPDNTEILSEYVQNAKQNISIFKYYDNNGALIASSTAMISDISYVTMDIIVNIDPLRSPGEFMLRGSAAPRNLKTNL